MLPRCSAIGQATNPGTRRHQQVAVAVQRNLVLDHPRRRSRAARARAGWARRPILLKQASPDDTWEISTATIVTLGKMSARGDGQHDLDWNGRRTLPILRACEASSMDLLARQSHEPPAVATGGGLRVLINPSTGETTTIGEDPVLRRLPRRILRRDCSSRDGRTRLSPTCILALLRSTNSSSNSLHPSIGEYRRSANNPAQCGG